jgi:hypothetical protein
MEIYKSKFDVKKSQDRCKKYRKKILDISQTVSALHMGGSSFFHRNCGFYLSQVYIKE